MPAGSAPSANRERRPLLSIRPRVRMMLAPASCTDVLSRLRIRKVRTSPTATLRTLPSDIRASLRRRQQVPQDANLVVKGIDPAPVVPAHRVRPVAQEVGSIGYAVISRGGVVLRRLVERARAFENRSLRRYLHFTGG